MESLNGLPNGKNIEYTGTQERGFRFPFYVASNSSAPSSPSDFSLESKGKLINQGGMNSHQRCSSDSFLMEEQPSWLDDLLNEPEDFAFKFHRRSASDSCTYLGEAAGNFTKGEKSKCESKLLEGKSSQILESSELVHNLVVENQKEESISQNLEGSADAARNSQSKLISASKEDAKRVKQQNAHRSRVRKLQYISHLERTVQILQAERNGSAADINFLEQQNAILMMENRALRQRLESISEEQMIKKWEQEMLEREIGRLQSLCHMQKQQQMQLHQQQQYPKHRQNRSREHDSNQAIPN